MNALTYVLYGLLVALAAPVSLLLWALRPADEAPLAHDDWLLGQDARAQTEG